ncbi:Serine/threonine-protein kinase PknB [Aquisphaera giovannonii]|uniref:non-specific serine/threonine protein kinase n=1 Tax=Aquisphaera giovannonii TaxID=406548 RepID=A0A5B9W787_9BACT|nr:protein kinase [Aquisphaera giovannonii]QEH36217.1 Serine/threonine-protein kinase PknB [Aquisphaera giovannonii]
MTSPDEALSTPAAIARAAVDVHRDRWRRGDRMPVEAYLEREGIGRLGSTELLDLVYGEVLLREEDGEAPQLDEYLRRFPDHAQALRDQFEIHEAIRAGGSFAMALTSPSLDRGGVAPADLTGTVDASEAPGPPPRPTAEMPAPVAEGIPAARPGPAPAPEDAPEPGWPRIEGFDIHGVLGSGGMGTVFRAFDRKARRHVALKTMNRAGAVALLRFKREFRTLLDVVHPNLVTLHELICDGRNWVLTMELLDGMDFLRHVRAGSDPAERERRLREALRQLAAGVSALHEAGKLHRDIKPSNVMVTPKGRVVLLDFGLAAEQEADGRHRSTEQHLVGTAAYMAPEQAAGRPVSAASDWYSVGVMLYEALAGRLPFRGGILQILMDKQRAEPSPPAAVAPGVPEDLDALCLDLLRRRPEERPSAAEVVRRLAGIAAAPRPEAGGGDAAPDPPPVPAAPALVGRDRHRRALDSALEDRRNGRPVAVYLHGSSGSGKTALLQSFLDDVNERGGAVVLSGRCYERESVPYKAFDSVIDALGRHLGRLGPAEVAGLLPRDVGSLARVFPGLRRVPAIEEAPRSGFETPDPQELRRRAFRALRELLARIGDRRPLIVAIDDLQWGDVDSAALLAELFRPPDEPVFLLLATYRREDRGRSPLLQALAQMGLLGGEATAAGAPRGDCRELAIDPLGTDEARALAGALLGGAGPGDAAVRAQVVDAIAAESRGNPFFVAELARHVLADGAAAAGEFPARADAPPGAASSGLALDNVLWARIRRLSPEARRLLELISLAGRPLRVAELVRCVEQAEDERVSLATLRAGRLIRSTGRAETDEVETYHDRIRESVASRIGPDLARSHHRTLALVLEASGRTDPEVLGEHFLGAGLPERAADHFARAADQAAEALAFERAAALYRRALDLRPGGRADDWRLRAALGDALANAGRGEEAAHAYFGAVPDAPASESPDLQRRAAMQLLVSGHIDEGTDALRTVLAAVGLALPDTPRRALASLLRSRLRLWLRGLRFRERPEGRIPAAELGRIDVCWSAGVGLSVVDTVRGADFQARGLLLALDAGEPSRIARALSMEAAHSASIGGSRRRETGRLLAIAEELSRRVDSPHALGMVTMARGVAAYLEGRWAEAQRGCDEAEAILRDRCTGVTWEINTANAFSLWALSHRGALGELSRRWPILLTRARDRGDLYAAMNLSSYLMSIVKLAEDDLAAARAGLEETAARWSRRGYHVQHNDALWAGVQIDLYRGDGMAGWERLRASWPALRGSLLLRVQFIRTSMRFLRARAAISAAAGLLRTEPSRARSLLAVADRDARGLARERMPCPNAFALLVAGGVAATRGDRDRAVASLRRALTAFEAVDMGLCAAATRRRLGELIGGDEGAAEVRRANDWMAGERVRDPSRMASMILAELPGRGA